MDPLPLLHLDDAVVAVDKPPGMLVHRSYGSGRGERFVLQTLSAQLGRYLHPVHRLDRNTSGVLLFALSREAARALQTALAAPDTVKAYLVLARGETPAQLTSERPLTNDRGEPRPARTDARRLAAFSRCSLLEVQLRTGRHHQIRRHLNHLAHHVVGDTTHGKGDVNRWFRARHDLPRMFIHARRLAVAHPDPAAGRLDVRSALPDDLRAFLRRLPDVPADLLAAL